MTTRFSKLYATNFSGGLTLEIRQYFHQNAV